MHWADVVELERKLRLLPAQRCAIVNGPAGHDLISSICRGAQPDSADAVVGFAACRADLVMLDAVYAAAREARVAWISYPKPGRMTSDLQRDWLARAVRQYAVEAVTHVSIDDTWSAWLLRPAGGTSPSLNSTPPGRILPEAGDSSLSGAMRSNDIVFSYQQQVSALMTQLAEMCEMAAHAMSLATQALLEADLRLAQRAMVRQRTVAAVGVHAKRAALLLPAWQKQPVTVAAGTVLTAVHIADDAERMGALAMHVATIARRRYPEHAVPDEFSNYVIDMDTLVLALAGHVHDVLLSRNALSKRYIQCGDAVVEELQCRLAAVIRDVGRAQGATAGVDITLLSHLYERFADHTVQIGRRAMC